MINVAFYDTKVYDRPSFEHYGSLHDIQFRFLETKLNEHTVELAKGCDVVCVFVNDAVGKDVIDRLYELGVKLIALRSAGYNNVDVKSAFGKIHVVHVPAYSPYAVAEHAAALLLTSIRRIHKAYNRTRDYNFSLNGLTGYDLHGKTVGVVGTGRIGRIFIDICRGFGMKVIAYDKFPAPDSGIDYVSLDELFERTGEFLEEIAFPEVEAGKDVLIMGHGAMNSAIICRVRNVPREDFWAENIANCRLIQLM